MSSNKCELSWLIFITCPMSCLRQNDSGFMGNSNFFIEFGNSHSISFDFWIDLKHSRIIIYLINISTTKVSNFIYLTFFPNISFIDLFICILTSLVNYYSILLSWFGLVQLYNILSCRPITICTICIYVIISYIN